VASAFELRAVAVEHPEQGNQPRLVLGAREREEYLIVDHDQASRGGLCSALEGEQLSAS
jgi:hypothetical protein